MDKKSGFAAIVGRPNAGKSTLLNAVLGHNLSIVTPKPQTTRNKIFGIYTKDNVQVVFVDTPGILKPRYKLQAFMKKEVESSFVEADIIILVVDASGYDLERLNEVYSKYGREFSEHKVFCVLNKIDLVRKEEILLMINDISKKFTFDELIPLSAQTGFNLNELTAAIEEYLPIHDFYFEDDIIASQPEKFFVSEIIRAQVLKMYKDEVPFSAYVEVSEFKEREKAKDFIRANIILEKESQKPIILGRRGAMIKLLGERSRIDIEDFLGHPVFLELFVKVRKNWKNDEEFLKKNFYRANISVI